MFFIGEDGSSGQVPDGTPLPPGSSEVVEAVYRAHLREQTEADLNVAVVVRHEEQLEQHRLQQLRREAALTLVGLGLTEQQAAVVAGIPVPEEF